MDLELAEKIARVVLYEGYILYPYRPSAVKNQQRWTFGGIYPQAYSQAHGETDPCTMETECLVLGERASLTIKICFLHLLWREVGERWGEAEADPIPDKPEFRAVESVRVGEKVFHTWQEAVEREVNLPNLLLEDLIRQPHRLDFSFPAS